MSILNKKIGILGGGQLGKMMILEAKRLGFYVITLDPAGDCSAHSISDEHIVKSFKDEEAVFELAKKVDVITYEIEHINAEALQKVEDAGHTVYPSVKSLKVIQDKYTQKEALKEADVAVPRFLEVKSVEDIAEAAKEFGYPMMLKARTGGYDGKGNAKIDSEANISEAYKELGSGEIKLMVEEFVPFTKEISVIACRGIDGKRVIYPVAENAHKNSILDVTSVPANISEEASKNAMQVADKVMSIFEGVGTFCVEMFVTEDNQIYINEIAPRPHNSGHYTIEGCFANQFENHIRAIMGLPLGSTDLIKPTAMKNILGEKDGIVNLTGLEEAYAKFDTLQLHLYGKKETQKGRKMGHITAYADKIEEAINTVNEAHDIIKL